MQVQSYTVSCSCAPRMLFSVIIALLCQFMHASHLSPTAFKTFCVAAAAAPDDCVPCRLILGSACVPPPFHCRCSYMEPVYASMQLVEQGKRFLMIDQLPSLQIACPIRIMHGVQVCACLIRRQLRAGLHHVDNRTCVNPSNSHPAACCPCYYD